MLAYYLKPLDILRTTNYVAAYSLKALSALKIKINEL